MSTSHRTGRCDSLVWVFHSRPAPTTVENPLFDPRPFGSTIRDSGYLAVFTSAWVAGLIKPVQSPDAVLETRLLGKPRSQGVGEPALELWRSWEDLWKKRQDFKPDWGNPAVRHYRGASENVTLVEMCSHLATERAGMGTLHLTVGASELYPNPV